MGESMGIATARAPLAPKRGTGYRMEGAQGRCMRAYFPHGLHVP